MGPIDSSSIYSGLSFGTRNTHTCPINTCLHVSEEGDDDDDVEKWGRRGWKENAAYIQKRESSFFPDYNNERFPNLPKHFFNEKERKKLSLTLHM